MTAPGSPIVVVGGGWSSVVAALLARRAGFAVTYYRQSVDPDMLPRPFPSAGHPGWAEFLSVYAPDGEWHQFGGAVADPVTGRRITDRSHSICLEATAGRFVDSGTDPLWAWAEPADSYLSFWDRLNRCLDEAGVESRFSGMPSIRGGLLRRARLSDWRGEAAPILVFQPDRHWRIVRDPARDPATPRCFYEGAQGRWCDASYKWGYFRQPKSYRPKAGEADTSTAGTWGIVPCRGLTVVSVCSPAYQPASGWFAEIAKVVGVLAAR